MKKLTNEIKCEKPNSSALGAFNSGLASSHIGYINTENGEINTSVKESIARNLKRNGINSSIVVDLIDAPEYVGGSSDWKGVGIKINKNLSISEQKKTAIHESTHLAQFRKNKLEAKDGKINWKGKEYMKVSDYNKIINKAKIGNDKEYLSLPWEKEARKMESKYK